MSAVCGFAALFAGLPGCVSEAGRSGPALWSSVDKSGNSPTGKLRYPGKTNLRFAELAERSGRHAQAREHYRAALSHDPKSVDAVIGIARLDQYAGDTDEAEKGFERALTLAPRNPKVLHSVGLFRAAQGRWTEALGLLQAAASAAPRSREYRKSLGLVLAKTGDFKGAWPHLAVSMGEGEAHYYIGSYLLERGDRQRAARQFQLAIIKSPDLNEARDRLAQLQRRQPQRDDAPIRSVGHVAAPNDAGTRSAWGGGRLHRAQQTNDRGPRSGALRHPEDESEIRIIPRSSTPDGDGPVIQPRQSRRPLRPRPDPIGNRPAGSDKLTPQQLQQWSNQRRVQ